MTYQNIFAKYKTIDTPNKINKPFRRIVSMNILLYHKGMQSLKNKEDRIKESERQKELNELSVATFEPNINFVNKCYTKKCILNLSKERTKEKKRNSLSEMDNRDMKNKFQPEISLLSRKIEERKESLRNRIQDRFQLLYESAIEKKERSKNKSPLTEDFSFKPKINQLNKKIFLDDKKVILTHYASINLENNKTRINELESINHTFSPKINNSSKWLKNKKPIEDRLKSNFEEAKKKKEYKILEINNERMAQFNKVKVDKGSEFLVDQKREHQFQKIFFSLEPSSSGYISAENIDLTKFPEVTAKLLQSIKDILSKKNIKINYKQFCSHLGVLIKNLLPDEKKDLIFKGKVPRNLIKKEKPKNSFHPSINLHSKMLARHLRPHEKDITKVFKQEQEKYQEKLNELVKMVEKKKMSECTFHPSIIEFKHHKNENEFIFEENQK